MGSFWILFRVCEDCDTKIVEMEEYCQSRSFDVQTLVPTMKVQSGRNKNIVFACSQPKCCIVPVHLKTVMMQLALIAFDVITGIPLKCTVY